MNLGMGAKSKKRVVLPNRPDPPTVEQILEDISKASSNDPVFSVLEDENQDADKGSSDNDVETKYLQSRKYLEVNEQLQKIKGELIQRREVLQDAGKQLEIIVEEVKGRAL
ncbi:hypothetical protein DPEC_G00270820 [Dallia pectoralis]|uniref:Uncharacterized protein n=1 Tax=Dallia pectoralis TaxID=75939 RepID=A0ACC2FPQ3_DALPE|nr:hypothetical protein DPEC_G00270820 [Dallia pectoralis]